MAEIRARTGARTLYINSTPKGVYCFDLGAITGLEWVSKMLPKSTDFPDGEKIEKQVAFIDIRHAELLLV